LHLNFGTLALVVEPEHEDAFLTEEPLKILKDGNFPHIPVLLGANQHDGSLVMGGAYGNFSALLEDPNYVQFELVPTLLNAIGYGDERLGSPISQSLADYYFPEDARKDNFTEIVYGLIDMMSVSFFKAPILRTADYLSQHSDKIFLYSFEHQGFNSLWTLVFDFLLPIIGIESPPFKGGMSQIHFQFQVQALDRVVDTIIIALNALCSLAGVTHADDLIYFWTLPFVITGKDRQFSDMVCKMWTDFAGTS